MTDPVRTRTENYAFMAQFSLTATNIHSTGTRVHFGCARKAFFTMLLVVTFPRRQNYFVSHIQHLGYYGEQA